MKFKLLSNSKDCKARAGEIQTDHDKIETPILMPVGTIDSVKAVHRDELETHITYICVRDWMSFVRQEAFKSSIRGTNPCLPIVEASKSILWATDAR